MLINRICLYILVSLCLCSCYKEQIQFGNENAQSHTRLLVVDTVTPVLSTYVVDSFPTSGNNILLTGRYKDPVTGTTTAQTFFQFGVPANVTTDLPEDATFDSLVLVMKPTADYYGDTTQPFMGLVQELEVQPDFTFANRLYNTSSCSLLPAPLATFAKAVHPNAPDSVQIRMANSKGIEFLNKINAKSAEIQDDASFQEYFKGLSIQPTASDTSGIYGFATDSSLHMTLYYHINFPYYEQRSFVFYPSRTTYQFNRILSDHTGTFLQPQTPGQVEFPATAANPIAVTQSGTGLLLKIKFPSLRNLLQLDNVIKLVDAKLVLKPVEFTFDPYQLRLPPTLLLAQTDATNLVGSPVQDAASGVAPDIDDKYRLNTNYTFPLTSYTDALLNTANSAESGVFVLQEDPGAAHQLNRAVIGSADNLHYRTQLVLTLLTID